MKKKYAALFVREDSGYKNLNRQRWDAYDINRDAANFKGGMPCVCHPPCRTWGVMAHMAFRNKDWTKDFSAAEVSEKQLALNSIGFVRENGGILEHPSGSRLFKKHLPDTGMDADEFGGFTILIDQFDFRHVAHKPTKLYICGMNSVILPRLPTKRIENTNRSIAGNVAGTKRCTQRQREYTPELLMDWFESVLDIITEQRSK